VRGKVAHRPYRAAARARRGVLARALLLALATVLPAPPAAQGVIGDSTRDLAGALSLVPAPAPDRLEGGVARVLARARADLDALLASPEASAAALARGFGDLGLLYHAHLILESAEPCYRTAIRLAPADFRWPYYLGYLHEQAGRPAPAAEGYAAALALAPDIGVARLRLGQALLALGRLEEAEPPLRAAAHEPELEGAARFALGRMAYARRDYGEAVTELERALAASPGASRVHHTLGLAYRALGALAEARDHLARRGERDPAFPDPLADLLTTLSTGQRLLFHRAMGEVFQGRHADAAVTFREGLALEPNNAAARVSLARALYLSGDRPGARAELEAVVRQAPRHALAAFLLGVLEEEAGEAAAAAARYREAIGVDPGHPGAHFFLANLLMRAGDPAGAAAHYRQSLVTAPRNPVARIGEALALIRAGAADADVRPRLEEALEAGPDDRDAAFLLAALLAASPDGAVRDGPRALALAGRLYEADPSPGYAEALAMACAQTGDFERAGALQELAMGAASALGRVDLLPRLAEALAAYRARRPWRAPWPAGGPPYPLPPLDATAVFRGYPSDTPY
jgi:tetratricopeptide (TPR) repeat protein